MSPACGDYGSGGIVSSDVKGARFGDPLAPEFFRLQGQSRAALPKHGALARVVDKMTACWLAHPAR